MRPAHTALGLLPLLLLSGTAQLWAHEPPAATADSADQDAATRDAVARCLPYLQRGGVAWMHEKGCMSCHHVPIMLWTLHAARAKGFDVDAARLAEWEEWARHDSLSRRNHFKLAKVTLAGVDEATLPGTIRQKLEPVVDQVFATEQEYTARLAELLEAEELQAHRQALLKAGALPLYDAERSGGGLDVLAQLILSRYEAPEDPAATNFSVGLREMIEQRQLADGSWTPGNQFATLRRWSKSAADQTTSMWAAMALVADASRDGGLAPPVGRARRFVLGQRAEPDNHEWLATRMLFEARTGEASAAAGLRDQLCASANADGGWSWVRGGPSDAYTTGLVLFALGASGLKVDRHAMEQARKHLLSTQQADGSWQTPARNISQTTVPERLAARDEIYHYWGTGWAALGLLATLPGR